MDEPWPPRPIIYEIYTWPWLTALSRDAAHPLSLSVVPDEQWDEIAALGVDAVWLMGVWERSPAGLAVSNDHAGLQTEFRRTLPDYTPADNLGSAYCVHRYTVDQRLGGPAGLAAAREKLAQRGLRLILDFVPNHVARDHPWVVDHPEFFVHGTGDDLAREPDGFFEAGGQVIACGRDPYFPPWSDVAQVNTFHPGLRQAVIDTLSRLARQCDGVRCDMAMLLLNDVFAQTWCRARDCGPRPAEEYWRQVIRTVRAEHPAFLFIAEAYWDLEWQLQQLGFDYCYDKRLYERLADGSAEEVRLHLAAGLDYQEHLIRFIENHDEPRAAALLAPDRARAAAVVVMTLPGAKLLFEGQLEGYRVRLPVFLRRSPVEPIDVDLQAFHRRLLHAVCEAELHRGKWQLCACLGWPDNNSAQNLLAWCLHSGEARTLVVVNFSDRRSQGQVRLPWPDLAGHVLHLTDPLSGDVYDRDGTQVLGSGLFVDLPGWGVHFFRLEIV